MHTLFSPQSLQTELLDLVERIITGKATLPRMALDPNNTNAGNSKTSSTN
jgi:hypothetical protein